MKILLIVHPDLIPPKDIKKADIDPDFTEWITEYDVFTTLKNNGHNVEILGVGENLGVIRTKLYEFKPNIVFNLLEEFQGEAIFDQNIVSYLELLRMPYTGSNPKGLMIGRDKALSKKILSFHKIGSPKFQVFPRNIPRRKVKINCFPLIVKCLNEEASLGISQASIVHNEDKLRERVKFIHEKYHTDAIAEQFIEGREYFVGVLGNYALEALPVWELKFDQAENPEKEFYSSNAKFNDEYRKRKGISTGKAKISEELEYELQRVAKKAYKALGLSGYARMDMRVDESGKIYVLEVNPNPDISEADDFAQSAKKAGYTYGELLNKIIKLGSSWSPTDT